jgi:hypothetical protein
MFVPSKCWTANVASPALPPKEVVPDVGERRLYKRPQLVRLLIVPPVV